MLFTSLSKLIFCLLKHSLASRHFSMSLHSISLGLCLITALSMGCEATDRQRTAEECILELRLPEACPSIEISEVHLNCQKEVIRQCGECEEGETRRCTNRCGTIGVERCSDGRFTECTVPDLEESQCQREMDMTLEPPPSDEGISDQATAECVAGESRPCQSLCGLGEQRCEGQRFGLCDAPTPTTESCGDEVDNDCDGEIDEDCPACVDGESRACESACGPGYETCQGGVYGRCRAQAFEEERCADLIDNDCDGMIDEACPTCEEREMRCDGLDDDCDGEVDESAVCGDLLHRHCEVRLAWSESEGHVAFDDHPPMTWPPLSQGGLSCPQAAAIDESSYSCDAARAESGFRYITIGSGSLGPEHTLGLSWACDANEQLTLSEQEVLSWASRSCHLSFGYARALFASILFDFNPRTCPLNFEGTPQNTFSASCISTGDTSGYSLLTPDRAISRDNLLGIAFYCEAEEGPLDISPSELAQKFQSEFQVFFAVHLGGDLAMTVDGAMTHDRLPHRTLDDGGRRRGVGTTANATFAHFPLSHDINEGDKLGVFTRVLDDSD